MVEALEGVEVVEGVEVMELDGHLKYVLHERNCQYMSCLKRILGSQKLMSSSLHELFDRIFNQMQLIYHLQIF